MKMQETSRKLSTSLPKVYVLHGWSTQDHDRKWAPFLSALEHHQLQPIFLRIPGLSAPLETVWGLDEYSAWLEQTLSGERNVVLIGHSFGGQLSIRYAAQHPEQVAQVVLIAAAGIRDRAVLPTLKRSIFWVVAKVGKVLFPMAWARTLLYRLARERDYQNAPPLLKRTMSLILDAEVMDDATQLQCPALLIWGAEDRVTPLKMGKQYQALIPQAQLRIIPSARHSPQFTHVTEVVQLIADFVVGTGGRQK